MIALAQQKKKLVLTLIKQIQHMDRKYEDSEVSLNDTVYDFSVDHSLINILNVYQYLTIKNDIK